MKSKFKVLSLAIMAFWLLGSLPWGPERSSALAQRRGYESKPWIKGHPKVRIKGRVLAVNYPVAVVETPQGRRYYVRLGPYWFWKERGYSLKEGMQVEISGFLRRNLIFPIVIRTPQGPIRLRDERGVPLFRPPCRCW